MNPTLRPKLPTQPRPYLRDGVINLGHAAGAHDEGVLTALNGPELVIVASRFRPSRELHRVIREQLVGAVEDSASSRFTRIVPVHTRSIEPAGPEELQQPTRQHHV